jgi:hypothetical protein
MISLLLELGADPLAVDGSGEPVAAYVTSPGGDRQVMEKIAAMTSAEFVSASRGHRAPRGTPLDLAALVSLGQWDAAARLLRENAGLIDPGGGVLHLMAKRNDTAALEWLLDHGADVNGRWGHWDAGVTPLHLAASQGHLEAARLLLAAGADSTVRDSKHDSDALGWASFFQKPDVVRLIVEQRGKA